MADFALTWMQKPAGSVLATLMCCILGWMIYETFSGAGNWKARWKKRLPFRWLVNFGGGRRNRGWYSPVQLAYLSTSLSDFDSGVLLCVGCENVNFVVGRCHTPAHVPTRGICITVNQWFGIWKEFVEVKVIGGREPGTRSFRSSRMTKITLFSKGQSYSLSVSHPAATYSAFSTMILFTQYPTSPRFHFQHSLAMNLDGLPWQISRRAPSWSYSVLCTWPDNTVRRELVWYSVSTIECSTTVLQFRYKFLPSPLGGLSPTSSSHRSIPTVLVLDETPDDNFQGKVTVTVETMAAGPGDNSKPYFPLSIAGLGLSLTTTDK